MMAGMGVDEFADGIKAIAAHDHGQTLTLAEFLLARIADDEAWAERAGSHNGEGVYEKDNHGCLLVEPGRVLAECEAKRRIVEAHPPYVDAYGEHCSTCTHDPDARDDWPCPTMLALAQPYADHPGFRDEWRLP